MGPEVEGKMLRVPRRVFDLFGGPSDLIDDEYDAQRPFSTVAMTLLLESTSYCIEVVSLAHGV